MAGSRLHSLTLHNFKSYTGNVHIGPFSPFTSIIGPNGSGKSNLMDAISFVLAVPTSRLRSTNVRELVAKGQREAAVMAAFAREDGSMREFTRSINGDHCMYSIDQTAATHAEYIAALQEEGINTARNAANFLVFQGDVEAIALKSARSLTALFEQMCGSDGPIQAEYEVARTDHEQAVEASTFAFNKRRGLSAEIKAVQEQKEEVVRFEELLSERQDVQAEAALAQLYAIEQTAKAAADGADAQEAELQKEEAECRRLEERLKDLRKERAKTVKQVIASEKNMKKMTEGADRSDPELIAVKERMRALTRKIKDEQDALHRNDSELARLQTEQSQISKELYDLQLISQQQIADLETRLHRQIPDSQEFEELRAAADTATAKDRLKLDAVQRKIAPDVLEKQRITEKMDELRLRLQQIVAELSIVNQRHQSLHSAHEAADRELKALLGDIHGRLLQRRRLMEEQDEAEDRLGSIAASLIEAKAIEEESERHVRLRLAAEALCKIFPGVHGRLVDLVQPVHRRYEEALAVVLGRDADAVVVDHARVAMECINYLREQRLGSLTFLPQDTLVLSAPRPNEALPEGVRLAVDLLRFDQQGLHRAVSFVCGRTVVCETVDQAQLAIKRGFPKAVILDGSVISENQFTGGALPGQSRNRWEQAAIAELKHERDRIMARLVEIHKELKKLDVQNRTSTDRLDVEDRTRYLSNELSAVQRKIDALDEEQEHVNRELTAYQSELTALNGRMAKSEGEITDLTERIDAARESVFASFLKQQGLTCTVKELEEDRSSIARALAEARSQFSALATRLSVQLQSIGSQVERLQSGIEADRSSLDKDLEAERRLSAELTQLEAQKDRQLASLPTVQEAVAQLKAQEKQMQEDIEEVRRELGIVQARAVSLARSIGMVQVEVERCLRDRDSLLQKCAIEQIYVPLLKGSLTAPTDSIVVDFGKLPKKIKDRVREGRSRAIETDYNERLTAIQSDIDRIAPNIRALDKLEGAEARLKQAMESFERQRTDAKRARDRFNAAKQARYARFMPYFKAVAERIDVIYKELTGGQGTAYLSVEDSEEPYLEGIRYHAMPPGKRFLDMDQLSGGEKTVAALALLFALYMTPNEHGSGQVAPFFILDEVDAALDNANVHHLASFVHRAAEHRQFIVISLKASFYEHSDALVGVYREPGTLVSRLLTLRLADYDVPAPGEGAKVRSDQDANENDLGAVNAL